MNLLLSINHALLSSVGKTTRSFVDLHAFGKSESRYVKSIVNIFL